MSLFENVFTAVCVLFLLGILFTAYKWTYNLACEIQQRHEKKMRLEFFARLSTIEYERAKQAHRDGDTETFQDAERKHQVLHLRFQRELADYYSRKS